MRILIAAIAVLIPVSAHASGPDFLTNHSVRLAPELRLPTARFFEPKFEKNPSVRGYLSVIQPESKSLKQERSTRSYTLEPEHMTRPRMFTGRPFSFKRLQPNQLSGSLQNLPVEVTPDRE